MLEKIINLIKKINYNTSFINHKYKKYDDVKNYYDKKEISDNKNHENDSKFNNETLKTLSKTIKSITENDNPFVLLRQILSAMITTTGARYGYLYINNNVYADHTPFAMSFKGAEVPIEEIVIDKELVEKVNKTHTMQRCKNVFDKENIIETICLRSDLCIPLNWREKYFGYIYLLKDKVSEQFEEGELELSLVLAAHAGVLLENACLMSKQLEFNKELQQQVRVQTKDILLKHQQLEDANLKLIESERMKSILSGTLVHDIKNYAAGISGNIAFLSHRIKNDPKMLRILDVVSETCSDITSLASNLLDIAKMDDGKMVVRKEMISYNFFETMAEKFSKNSLFEEKEIRTKILPPDYDFLISADIYLMERVMQNLYSNAAKYAPFESSVELSFSQEKEEFIISFFNSGEPIPENEKNVLFEKYASIQNRHTNYSKGLGLFFCRMVLQAHQGRIWLDTDSKGNYFKMAFPIKTEQVSNSCNLVTA